MVSNLGIVVGVTAALLSSPDWRVREAVQPGHVAQLLAYHTDPEVAWRSGCFDAIARRRLNEWLDEWERENGPLPWIDSWYECTRLEDVKPWLDETVSNDRPEWKRYSVATRRWIVAHMPYSDRALIAEMLGQMKDRCGYWKRHESYPWQ